MPRAAKKIAKFQSIQKEIMIKPKITPIKNFNLPIFFIFFMIFIAYIFYYLYSKGLAESITEKSSLPRASLDYDYKIWGSYRPQLYFGLRTRHPLSSLFGLIWYKQPRNLQINSLPLRHWCDHGDAVQFMCEDCDGNTFGHQIIKDDEVEFDTFWLNHNNNEYDSDPHSWSSRIKVKKSEKTYVAFIVYFFVQDPDVILNFINKVDNNSQYKMLMGFSKIFGNFSLSFSNPLLIKDVSYVALNINLAKDLIKIEKILIDAMKRVPNSSHIRLANISLETESKINFIAVQFNIKANSSIDIHYNAKESLNNTFSFKTEFKKRLHIFRKKFESTFPITKEEMSGSPQSISEKDLKRMGRIALSSLLGGIGYWYGDVLVDSKSFGNEKYRKYGPLALFSAVPSRSFFPRGFIWDEGFHNLIIRKYNPLLSLEIISSWLDTMNNLGWIPREIILGVESQAKVPSEFLIQHDFIANPPVFIFVIEKFLKDKQFMLKHSSKLKRLYPRLKQWYIWLRSSQIGPNIELGAFQWQGRNSSSTNELNPKTLPSGLDDYPRATHPSVDEYHLDLRCWMAVASRVIRTLSEQSNDIAYVNKFDSDVKTFNDIEFLDKLHWSEKVQRYCDYGYHSTNVRLKNIQRIKEHERINEKIREVLSKPELRLVEDAYGYISLLPFMLKLLPSNSPKLFIIIKNLRKKEELWSPFGLRSLSTKSPYYMKYNTKHDPPYWRGAVWINMNYLALDALYYYGSDENGAPLFLRNLCKDLYKELKWNILNNINKQFKKTGFFWENYNDVEGKGQGTRPFTGWTSLVLNILANSYD